MYTWRCFLAIIFVLVWYFSEFGQIWTQAFICFLCFLNVPFKKQDCETSTQTDDTLEETAPQVTLLYQRMSPDKDYFVDQLVTSCVPKQSF